MIRTVCILLACVSAGVDQPMFVAIFLAIYGGALVEYYLEQTSHVKRSASKRDAG